ncbi:YlxR family protein [Desulfonatronovibrio hydrogenovorans]|uniref:YlxR family protein n=1 Tax=Desulfonatronovibrio hydrogenovorans TaxID=53245 RepID=UPI000A049FBB|nr:DUF448 domain-containing protein [Desulfonatronovibrio hydrogenovorans]
MNNHVPIRTCVICRRKKPKSMLLRYACPGDLTQGLVPDPDCTIQARGFYTCRDLTCAEKIAGFRGWIRKCKGVASNVE